jgi:antitoxin YefM
MKLMTVSEVKARLSRLVTEIQAGDEEIVITRNGRAAAVLLSADQFEGWRETVEVLADKELMTEIRRGLRAPKRRLTRREAAALFR